MKAVRIILFLIATAAIIFGAYYWHERMVDNIAGMEVPAPGDNETYAHKIKRYRAGADTALLAECTNRVVGLRNIINPRTETADNNFTTWTASAAVEYFNTIGGIERTNLEFRFEPGFSGQPRWIQK